MSLFITNPDSAKTARRTRNRVRLAAAAAASIALFGATTPAWAATNTITVGSAADLTVKIAIAVPVTIVCDPLSDPGVASQVFVSVKQANGKQISTGSGQLYATPGTGTVLTCDGSTQNNVVVRVLADQGSGPFKNGAAYVTASFEYTGGIDYGGGYYSPTGTERGTTTAAIKLH
ncbi:hypothetical protein SAMN04487846_2012 [Microbacterium sp. cf046]|uniref:hypothetical protein n=1 Tax=Microbacterium sp. cf046 TaxID=1761803 RepID=UPI0008EDA312|nr:hypothetical protein [Microbacterium sp. cf046]SFS05687.1 hypothetical protein SAMN04487846_2012 [Microbacterium sp. cf046]